MMHNSKGRAFNRPSNQRAALVRSLARALVLEERISTTEAKAKELRPFIEKLVTRAKADTVANRRLVQARIGSPEAVKKLFTTLAKRYEKRDGGYTRIVKRPATANGRMTAYIAFV